MRRRSLLFLSIGIVLGIVLTPLAFILAAQKSQGAQAQSQPFTPTTEPSETPTPTTVAPTTTPQVIVVTATSTTMPATATPTPTMLPPGFGSDACAPNQTLEQPCALSTETDIPNLSFNDGPVDVFSFLLKGGRQYRISAIVGQQGGIDPSIDVFLAGGAEQPIASNDDVQIGNPSAVITMTVQTDAWYLVRVSNKSPGGTEGKTYTMSARSVGGASSGATPQATNPDDLFGNAYDVAHAGRLAWGVPYDLSMNCPDSRPNACYSGRHLFLFVPIKAGIPFTAVTYDLGVGVDTNLTLYEPDQEQQQEGPGVIPGWRVVTANDDVAPGWTLRSQITLVPNWNAMALLVVAPSDREDMPPMPSDGRPGRYRLIVGSSELPQIKSVLGGQQDLPPTPAPPTPRPTGQPAPAAISTQPALDNREVIKEDCPAGTAEVGAKGADLFAAAPPADGDKIASYPEGALVKLLGQCYRGWVKAQPIDSVTPGWMWGPNLRPEEIGPPPTAITGPTTTPQPGTGGATSTATPSAVDIPSPPVGPATPQPLVLVPLAPAPAPTAALAVPAARSLTIKICRATRQPNQCGAQLAGVRVDLLLAATQEIRVSGVTDDTGQVTLSTSIPSGTRLLVQVPALGAQAELADVQSEITVRVPEES